VISQRDRIVWLVPERLEEPAELQVVDIFFVFGEKSTLLRK
jgi:hypothetical protein